MPGDEVSSRTASKHSQTLQEICDILEPPIIKRGIAKEAAGLFAEELVIALGNHFGGRQFYMPKGKALKAKLRDVRIYRMCSEVPVSSIASIFNLSEAHVYNIIAEQREIDLRRRAAEALRARFGKPLQETP